VGVLSLGVAPLMAASMISGVTLSKVISESLWV
jgi:hypothetical protein